MAIKTGEKVFKLHENKIEEFIVVSITKEDAIINYFRSGQSKIIKITNLDQYKKLTEELSKGVEFRHLRTMPNIIIANEKELFNSKEKLIESLK